MIKNKITELQKNNFWKKVNKTNHCWLWTGAITSNGYGSVSLFDKSRKAHQISYRIKHNLLPIFESIKHLTSDNTLAFLAEKVLSKRFASLENFVLLVIKMLLYYL